MALINIDRNPFPEPISVKWNDSVKIVNGSFISYKNGVEELDQELFDGKKIMAKGGMNAFVAEPFHPYRDDEEENDMEFTKGDVVRAFPIKAGIEITVSKADCVDGDLKVGDPVTPKATSTKITKDTDGSATIGYVVKVYNFNGQDSVRIRFI